MILIGVKYNTSNVHALSSTKNQKNKVHYENLFKKYSFEDLDGKIYKLTKVKEKYILLNFWATWCAPCTEEMPDLVQMYSQNKGKVLVLAINREDGKNVKKVVKKYIKEHKLNFPIVLDKDGKITSDYHIEAIPESILYSSSGKVIKMFDEGAVDFTSESFKELIK